MSRSGGWHNPHRAADPAVDHLASFLTVLSAALDDHARPGDLVARLRLSRSTSTASWRRWPVTLAVLPGLGELSHPAGCDVVCCSSGRHTGSSPSTADADPDADPDLT